MPTRDRRGWNSGDALHWAQIAVLLLSLSGFYWRTEDMITQVRTHTGQLTRIEHYLSSRDANYWNTVRDQ